jgi:hypothetical protein
VFVGSRPLNWIGWVFSELVPQAGIEPATYRLEGERSIR